MRAELTPPPNRTPVSTTQRQISEYWAGDVEVMEGAIGRFTEQRPLANECRVAFFEITGDRNLHVNVTHKRQTATARGWSGPAIRPDGYVHNRIFGEGPASRIVRSIREMVFANNG